MLGFKFGAPTPKAPGDGKIQEVTEVQTDGKGQVTGSKVTPIQAPAPNPLDEE